MVGHRQEPGEQARREKDERSDREQPPAVGSPRRHEPQRRGSRAQQSTCYPQVARYSRLSAAVNPRPYFDPMRALIFDLDGTLVDTVYAHVFAWQRAFAEAGMPIDGWRIHRRIGMSGGLFARAVARELGRSLPTTRREALQRRHGELFRELLPERRPLPGAVELLAELRARGIVHGIATSGRRPEIDASLEALGVPPGHGRHRPRRRAARQARAGPVPRVPGAARRPIEDCYVVGDAVWDLLAARRARMLSVGLLTGGYGEDELRAPARSASTATPAELHDSLDELGLAVDPA